VDEGGRLERVVLSLPPQLPAGLLAQLLVDEGYETVERSLLSVSPGRQQPGDVMVRRGTPMPERDGFGGC
jgi:hypothetical protein